MGERTGCRPRNADRPSTTPSGITEFRPASSAGAWQIVISDISAAPMTKLVNESNDHTHHSPPSRAGNPWELLPGSIPSGVSGSAVGSTVHETASFLLEDKVGDVNESCGSQHARAGRYLETEVDGENVYDQFADQKAGFKEVTENQPRRCKAVLFWLRKVRCEM